MSGLGPIPPLQTLGIGIADAALIAVVLTGGLVGMSIRNMFDSILSDDGEPADVDASDTTTQQADGEEAGMADGGLMAEEGGDFGELGGMDDEGGDDAFGDDEFGEMDDAGAGSEELEHRLDELENEVGSLSSTVNTVRTENEQISESVEDVEENVRKLLDIYEMVTRGVNPFADDIESGMGGGMGEGGSFGLFDNDDGGGGNEESLDQDIADADAEGFFDEDLVDDGDDDMDSMDDMDGGEDMFGDDAAATDDDSLDDDFEDDFDDDFGDDFDDGGADGGADGGGDGDAGKSFQELKDEYDSGDAEWAEGEAPPEAGDGPNDAATAETSAAEESAEPADPAPSTDEGGSEPDLGDDELFDEVIEEPADGTDPEPADVDAEANATPPEPEPEPAVGGTESATQEPVDDDAGATEPAAQPSHDTPDETGGSVAADEPTAGTSEPTAAGSNASGAGKPYLAELPGGFTSDLIVVEWLEFLTERSSYRATDEAIQYYERIEWISPAVAAELREYLRGFDSVTGEDGSLTIDDHTQSLQYISQLDGGGGTGSMALSKLVGGGGGNGLQR